MPRKRIETRMEIENEVPDPPNVLIENISEDRIEPIAVDIDEIPFDDCKFAFKCNRIFIVKSTCIY